MRNGWSASWVRWSLLLLLAACGGGRPAVMDPLPRERWNATSSTGEGDYQARLAVDGNRQTRWSSNFTDNEWIQVDFGAERAIAGLRIQWETAYGRDYDLFLSSDGSQWTKVYEVRWGDGNLDEIFFGARQGRFLKIAGVKRGTGWGYSIWEMDPIGPEEMPALSSSSAASGSEPATAMDGSLQTAWRTASGGQQTLSMDLKRTRDLGGVELHWGDEYAVRYQIETSLDGISWTPRVTVTDGDGGEDLHYFARTDARHLRLVLLEGPAGTYALQEAGLKGGDESWNPMRHFESLLTRLPEGSLPRWVRRQQEFWTIAGVPDDKEEALISEDGTIEPAMGAFSVMPFLVDGRRILTARQFGVTQSLEDGYLPLPSVRWSGEGLSLDVSLLSTGEVQKSIAAARYVVTNAGSASRSVRLALAVRPLQLNPPWQYGGFSKIDSAEFSNRGEGRVLILNGRPALWSVDAPSSVGAVAKSEGDIFQFLQAGKLPESSSARDSDGVVTAALAYDLELAAGETRAIIVVYPMHPESPLPTVSGSSSAWFAARFAAEAARWRDLVDGWDLDCPIDGLANAMRSNLAYMLLNRDFKAAQPGPRNYAKAWMRDGAMSSATYLQFGMDEIAKGYLEWFTGLVDADGFVPPLVQSDNDKIPDWAKDWKEYDSQGEYVYAVREYFEFTKDQALLRRLYPTVLRALAYQQKLIDQRKTDQYRGTEYWGILPESNSHEGYFPAKHSYWDDFWALRGLKDGVALAEELGDRENAARLQKELEVFRNDFYASMRMVIEKKRIGHVPGCAELGDPDATSTSIAIMCCGEMPHLLADTVIARALASGYDDYFRNVTPRWTGGEWQTYTPYEARNADALIRMGRRDDGIKLLSYFVGDPMRPRAWNHMAEVVHRDPRTGSYIGDMPHTWVGAGLIQAARTAFVYEEEGNLVLVAGAPEEWYRKGFSVTALPTWYGRLTLRAVQVDRTVTIEISGSARPTSFVLRHPFGDRIARVKVNGAEVPHPGVAPIVVAGGPATVVIELK